MSCQNHPNKESIANCQFCGKELCEDCAISIAGKSYCEECMSDLVGPELTSIAAKQPGEAQETPTPKQTPTTPPIQETPTPKQTPTTPPIQETPTPKQTPTTPSIQDKEPHDDLNNGEYDDIYSDDRLYDDIHRDESPSTNQGNNEVEEKYEKYLDDLYFDEENAQEINSAVKNKGVPLGEQLAQDEAEHGSITKDPYVPEELLPEPTEYEDNKSKNVPIMKNLRNVDSDTENEEGEHTLFSIHQGRIHYKNKESDSYTSTEKYLTIVLIILIILVSIYIIYLLTLHDYYPSIIDAITAFVGNPGEVIGQMFR